jgi:hypothetical protein
MRDQDGKADTLGQLNLTRLHVITTQYQPIMHQSPS